MKDNELKQPTSTMQPECKDINQLTKLLLNLLMQLLVLFELRTPIAMAGRMQAK